MDGMLVKGVDGASDLCLKVLPGVSPCQVLQVTSKAPVFRAFMFGKVLGALYMLPEDSEGKQQVESMLFDLLREMDPRKTTDLMKDMKMAERNPYAPYNCVQVPVKVPQNLADNGEKCPSLDRLFRFDRVFKSTPACQWSHNSNLQP